MYCCACDTGMLLQPNGTTRRMPHRSFNIDIGDMMQVGDLVYCRITSAERDLDPILACTDVQGKVRRSFLSGSHTHASCLYTYILGFSTIIVDMKAYMPHGTSQTMQ